MIITNTGLTTQDKYQLQRDRKFETNLGPIDPSAQCCLVGQNFLPKEAYVRTWTVEGSLWWRRWLLTYQWYAKVKYIAVNFVSIITKFSCKNLEVQYLRTKFRTSMLINFNPNETCQGLNSYYDCFASYFCTKPLYEYRSLSSNKDEKVSDTTHII